MQNSVKLPYGNRPLYSHICNPERGNYSCELMGPYFDLPEVERVYVLDKMVFSREFRNDFVLDLVFRIQGLE